jgi:hypothetical protein
MPNLIKHCQQRFSLRKLSVGAASVAIGLFLAVGKPVVVHADAPVKSETTEVAKPTEKPSEAVQADTKSSEVLAKANTEKKAETAKPVEERTASEEKPDTKVEAPAKLATPKSEEQVKNTEQVADTDKVSNKETEPVKTDEKVKDADKTATKELSVDKKSDTKDAAKNLVEKKVPAKRSRGAEESTHFEIIGEPITTEYGNKIYDVSGWRISVSGGNAYIANYHGKSTEVTMPNASDLIQLGVIAPGHTVHIDGNGFFRILHYTNADGQGIKSLTISNDNPANCEGNSNKVHTDF